MLWFIDIIYLFQYGEFGWSLPPCCNGLVMASLPQPIPLPLIALETETITAARALEFALELGLNSIILEGDYEIHMKSLMEDSLSIASSSLLI